MTIGEHNVTHLENRLTSNDPSDAVIIALQKLSLAPCIGLQSHAVKIIEGLKTHKNVG